MLWKGIVVAAVATLCALLGVLDAWAHDRNPYFAGLVFAVIGLIPALIAVYALDRRPPRRRR